MEDQRTVALENIIKEFNLEVIYMSEREHTVKDTDVNRPGLPLAGFFDYFGQSRIQIIGNVEHEYLDTLDLTTRHARLSKFLSYRPPALIVTTGLEIFPDMKALAERFDVPLLRTVDRTSEFMAALIASLHLSLAPCITRHGVFVEVYGEGVLILGDSGVGKSETAIELVKRGHRLVADDAVVIKKVSAKTLVGSAPDIIRHYVELRGIGVVDVRRIFGMGAVKVTEKVDLIINLENWVQGKMYDRFGLESEYTNIMGINIPTMTIPVKPGRNLAVILEIAAMNNRQKKMGYDTAYEFNKRLMDQMQTNS